MNEELEAISAVSRAVNKVTRNGRFAELELSNGIILALKPVPPLLLQAINNEFVQPPPPKIYMEEKGREEENPNDPEYLKLLEKLAAEQELAVNDMVLGVGTSVKSIPEGMYPPESDDWIPQVKFAAKLANKELEMDISDPVRRYLYWLRFYAMETSADVIFARTLPLQLTGIREGEVEEVMESFRGLPERGSNTDSPVETGNNNGNTANRASRRGRPRNRGT